MSHRAPAMVAVVDRQLCDACGLCMPLCPPAAIAMRRDGLLVDPVACTGCRKCIAPCPVGALRMVDDPALIVTLPAGAVPTAASATNSPAATA